MYQHEQDTERSADGAGRVASDDGAHASSLAPSRFLPIRGVLRLLVQASTSRSIPSRLGAWLILIAVLSAFAYLGYFLPSLISPGARS